METESNANILYPNPYAADCPTRKVLDFIGDKWTTLILLLLEDSPKRFLQLQRSIQGISHKMLTQTLRDMERDGLISRKMYAEIPPRVEYTITPLGHTLCGPISAIVEWSKDHIGEVVEAQERYDARGTENQKAGQLA